MVYFCRHVHLAWCVAQCALAALEGVWAMRMWFTTPLVALCAPWCTKESGGCGCGVWSIYATDSCNNSIIYSNTSQGTHHDLRGADRRPECELQSTHRTPGSRSALANTYAIGL